jgi:nucleotide-binding universal stress UspA family protein
MSEKYIVACDGSSASERALDFAVANAKSTGASILVAHVLEWSPYSFLTPEELEERHKRRAEELDRAQKAVVDKIVKSTRSSSRYLIKV